MAAEGRHLPKFGSWDNENDNIPYTAYFDNARKDKTAKIINPNDPEENPEAFNHQRIASGNLGIRQNQRQMKKYDKQSSLESGNFVLSSPGNDRNKNAGNPYDDHSYISAASVPKFGAWDEMDPNSGDGFTVIFNRIKEEKQIAASKPSQPSSSTVAPPSAAVIGRHNSNNNTKVKSKILSCCIFPKAKDM